MSIAFLELFYRDVDLFLENIFMGGLATADKQSIEELETLIVEAKKLDISFLREKLEELDKELSSLHHSVQKDVKRAATIYYLLCDYISLSLKEIATIKIEEEFL